MNRYARQIVLPEIGEDGQKKLKNASILCVGAGGLGSPAMLYLAAAGIGRIGIIDFDRVDVTNLQRQILFSSDTLGQSKAKEAAKRITALNPEITVEVYDAELNADSADFLFPSYDIILDGTDNFQTKYLINDAAVKHNKPWLYGAIQGFDGQAAVFNMKGSSCYRCLYPAPPEGFVPNCAQAGVIGAVAGIVGVTQSLQAIQLITGHPQFEPLFGKLWLIDTRTMHSKTLNLPKDPHCPACSKKKAEIVLSYASPVCGFIPEVTTRQLRTMTDIVLIDVREAEEYAAGNISEAKLWPLSRLRQGEIPDLPRDKNIVLHCQKGFRSLQAAQILKAYGYPDVYSLAGGYEDWLKYTGI